MKTKLSVYVLTLTYSHELWAVTRRMSLWIRMQVVEIASSVGCLGSILEYEELSYLGEALLLHIKNTQLRWFGHLARKPPGAPLR